MDYDTNKQTWMKFLQNLNKDMQVGNEIYPKQDRYVLKSKLHNLKY